MRRCPIHCSECPKFVYLAAAPSCRSEGLYGTASAKCAHEVKLELSALLPFCDQVSDLKAELQKRGLPTTGVKATLAERLESQLLRHSLSDDNFRSAPVVDSITDDDLPNCFPRVHLLPKCSAILFRVLNPVYLGNSVHFARTSGPRSVRMSRSMYLSSA